MQRVLVLAAVAPLLALPSRTAHALQPLASFLENAKTWNPDNRAAHATVEQRDAEVSVSSGNLAPNLQFNALYTHNQYEVSTGNLFTLPPQAAMLGITIPNEIIQPQNQIDANIMLTVPLINIANWDRRSVAKATLDGAKADAANAGVNVQKNVTRDYYQLLGYEAVLQSAMKNLDVAHHNVKLARDKKRAAPAPSSTSSAPSPTRRASRRRWRSPSSTSSTRGATSTR